MQPRKLREYKQRVESGPVVFGPDWPGVFIRGDNALGYALNLRGFLKKAALRMPDLDPITQMYLVSLADLLESCRVTDNGNGDGK